jgi:hypothetical protein
MGTAKNCWYSVKKPLAVSTINWLLQNHDADANIAGGLVTMRGWRQTCTDRTLIRTFKAYGVQSMWKFTGLLLPQRAKDNLVFLQLPHITSGQTEHRPTLTYSTATTWVPPNVTQFRTTAACTEHLHIPVLALTVTCRMQLKDWNRTPLLFPHQPVITPGHINPPPPSNTQVTLKSTFLLSFPLHRDHPNDR